VTGGVIHFGYSRSNSNGAGGTIDTTSGIDNWSFTVNQVPEPSLSALMFAACLLPGRRRRQV